MHADSPADDCGVAERRQHERYPVWALGRIWWDPAGEPLQARVADISLGGAAVEIDGPIEADRFLLQFGMGDQQQPFPLAVTGGESTWHGTIVHGRFEELHAMQAARLEAIMEQWLKDYQASLARMVYRGGSAA